MTTITRVFWLTIFKDSSGYFTTEWIWGDRSLILAWISIGLLYPFHKNTVTTLGNIFDDKGENNYRLFWPWVFAIILNLVQKCQQSKDNFLRQLFDSNLWEDKIEKFYLYTNLTKVHGRSYTVVFIIYFLVLRCLFVVCRPETRHVSNFTGVLLGVKYLTLLVFVDTSSSVK